MIIYYCKVKKEDDEGNLTNERRGWLDKLLLLLSCEDSEHQSSCSTLDGLAVCLSQTKRGSKLRSWIFLRQGPTHSLPACR